MRYLIDTDRVVEYLRGRPSGLRLVASFAEDELFISLIAYGEIYDGFDGVPDPIATEAGFRRFLINVEIVPLDEPLIRRFFRIRRDLRQRGLPLEDPDLLIAATALHHDLTVVTRNRRHFARVPGLKFYS